MFEKIKRDWQKKIGYNAYRSTLTYKDSKGIERTEDVIFKRSSLPLGDWARIYPPINENGTLNVLNLFFGGWRNFIKLVGILVVIAFVMFQFYQNFDTIRILTEQLTSTGFKF